jgi:hypothetical protein
MSDASPPARWSPGMKSPNPRGRPKGIVDRRQKLQAAFADDAVAIAKVVIAQALEGDMQAAGIALARLMAPLKAVGERVEFQLDPHRPLADQAKQILAAVAGGKVDPETGKTLIGCLSAVANIEAVAELENRIIVLEARSIPGMIGVVQ